MISELLRLFCFKIHWTVLHFEWILYLWVKLVQGFTYITALGNISVKLNEL